MAMKEEFTLELTFTLEPEELEGGYTRYASSDLPGFRILCQPRENPIPLIEEAASAFIPTAISAHFDHKLILKGLRLIPSPKTFFSGARLPIEMEAELARA